MTKCDVMSEKTDYQTERQKVARPVCIRSLAHRLLHQPQNKLFLTAWCGLSTHTDECWTCQEFAVDIQVLNRLQKNSTNSALPTGLETSAIEMHCQCREV